MNAHRRKQGGQHTLIGNNVGPDQPKRFTAGAPNAAKMKGNMEKMEFHFITSDIPATVCVCGDYSERCSIYDTYSHLLVSWGLIAEDLLSLVFSPQLRLF